MFFADYSYIRMKQPNSSFYMEILWKNKIGINSGGLDLSFWLWHSNCLTHPVLHQTSCLMQNRENMTLSLSDFFGYTSLARSPARLAKKIRPWLKRTSVSTSVSPLSLNLTAQCLLKIILHPMSCVLLYRRTLFDASFIDFQTHLLAQDGLKELLSSHYGLQWHEFCPGYLN